MPPAGRTHARGPNIYSWTPPTIPEYFLISAPPHASIAEPDSSSLSSSPRPRRPYAAAAADRACAGAEVQGARRRDVGRGHGDLGGAAARGPALGSHRGGRRGRGGGSGRGAGIDDDDLLERPAWPAVVVPVADAEDVGEPPRAAVRGRQPRRRRHRSGRQQALLAAAARRGQGGPAAGPPRGGGGGGAARRGGGGRGPRGRGGGLSAAAEPARPTTTRPPRHVPLHRGVAVAVPAEAGPRRRARQAAVLGDALGGRDRGGRVRAHGRPPAPPPPPPAPRRAEQARYAAPRRVAIGDHRGDLPGARRSVTSNPNHRSHHPRRRPSTSSKQEPAVQIRPSQFTIIA